MTDSLHQRVAIITGSAGGLGRVIAGTLASKGAIVVISDLDSAHGQIVADSLGGVLFVPADITDPSSIANLVEQTIGRYGRIDILINNAAVTGHHPLYESRRLLDSPLDFWRWVLDVNVTGQFNCIQAVGRAMAERGSGVIVNITSITGLQPTPETSAYCVSKAAVNMLTKCAALELADYDIRVNAVAPNGMYRSDSERPRPVPAARVLANRVAEFSDIADVVAFLCSDDARYITGQIVSVDGGETVGMRRQSRKQLG